MISFLKVLNHFSKFHPQANVLYFVYLRKYSQARTLPKYTKGGHCYKNLHPWQDIREFGEYLASTVVYNKDGLIALNKPFGVKIHRHDKPGARSEPGKHKMVASIPECRYTIEDAIPTLKECLKAYNLSILKSAEKYTSGIVLLGTNDDVAECVQKSFAKAKQQQIPHLVHWMLTLGYPVTPYRKEKVGIKFLESGENEPKQPVITVKISKTAVKRRLLYPVNVEYKVLAMNRSPSSSLVEIATSSVVYHFVRVYASSRISPILGDVLYGSRMNTVMGVPVKIHIQHAQAYDMQPLPAKMSEALKVPKGIYGHVMMPTMLHLHKILLPSFAGESDVNIVAPPPTHFQWTAENLNLLHNTQ